MLQSRVLVAQLGARKHYQEPLLFHRWGILERLYTDFYSGHNLMANLLRNKKIYSHLPNILKKSLDRYEPGLKNAQIIHFPRFGYQYLKALKECSEDQISQIFIWGGQEFCRRIIKDDLGNTNVIYGFNSASLELFEYAKQQGIFCILDQTLADYSLVYQLLLEEEKYWEGWSLTPFKVSQADLKLMIREHQEQDLADKIICGSNFVKDSLMARGVKAEKISVVPLGRLKEEKLLLSQNCRQTPEQRGDELKILFVGSVNLRKGIPYLLEALRQIKQKIPFTCQIVGALEIKPERLAEYQDVCKFLGRIPRSQVKDLYTWADVLVLPSICEGSAMVTYEALNCRLPVITTYNSGSIVRDEIDGFIVPIRDSKAIADKLITSYKKKYYDQQIAETQNYVTSIFEHSESNLRQLLIRETKFKY